MNLNELTCKTAGIDDLDVVYNMLKLNFPPHELHPRPKIAAAIQSKYFIADLLLYKSKPVLLTCRWDLPYCEFWEYLAVHPDFHNQGIGSKFMRDYFQRRTSEKPCLLEVELPQSELALRRINFYKRLGFIVQKYEYWQPEINPGHGAVPFKLMAYGRSLPYAEYETCVLEMMQMAYGRADFDPLTGRKN